MLEKKNKENEELSLAFIMYIAVDILGNKMNWFN